MLRGEWLLLGLAACGFDITATPAPDAAVDAPPDAAIDAMIDAAPPRLCAADPLLVLCFSFDQDPLPVSLPNEGTGVVTATLTDVTRIARTQDSGAAQLGASGGIVVPMGTGVTGILSMEVWFRVDAMPANNGGRMGLFDSNTSQNMSLFLYRADPGHQLRCGLGNQTEVFAATLSTATWHHAECTCENGAMHVYLDGALVEPARPGGCSGGAIIGDGLTIGSDNGGNGGSAVGDRLAGAIDGIRMWAVSD